MDSSGHSKDDRLSVRSWMGRLCLTKESSFNSVSLSAEYNWHSMRMCAAVCASPHSDKRVSDSPMDNDNEHTQNRCYKCVSQAEYRLHWSRWLSKNIWVWYLMKNSHSICTLNTSAALGALNKVGAPFAGASREASLTSSKWGLIYSLHILCGVHQTE